MLAPLVALTVDVNLHGGGTSLWVPVLTAGLAGGAALGGAKLGAKATLDAEKARAEREVAAKAADDAKELKVAARQVYIELVHNKAILSSWVGVGRPEELNDENWRKYSVVIAAEDDALWRRCAVSYMMISLAQNRHTAAYFSGTPDEDHVKHLVELAGKDAAILSDAIKVLKVAAQVDPAVIRVNSKKKNTAEGLGTKDDPVPKPTGKDRKQQETPAPAEPAGLDETPEAEQD